MYRVVVAEDEPRILANLVRKIEAADPAFRVVATAANGTEALAQARSLEPDVVFTDIVMPMMSGLDMVAALRDARPGVAVVIVSGYSEFPYARRAIALGVAEFLLKPVRAADVAAALGRLRERLEARDETLTLEDVPVPPEETDDRFAGFLVCVGSLCAAAEHLAPAQSELLRTIWRTGPGFPPSRACSEARWWRLREAAPNQRLLIASGPRIGEPAIARGAREILDAIAARAAPYAVTVCSERSAVSRDGLADHAAMLRSALARGLRMGEPQVLIASAILADEVPTALLPREAENEIVVAAQRSDGPLLHGAFVALLERWLENRCPQVCIEQASAHLARVVQSALPAVTEDAVLRAEQDIARAIARSPASGPLVDDVAGILQRLVAGSGRLDGPDIVSLVRDFLDHHYGQPIALSALGERLGFDESYVTRLFKSATGEPPIRYLTRVRVEHAQRLLRDRQELDVGEIGRIVGYPDQHYFCRVFRKLTGANPTEYRGSPAPGS